MVKKMVERDAPKSVEDGEYENPEATA